jgi:hypothetical protein
VDSVAMCHGLLEHFFLGLSGGDVVTVDAKVFTGKFHHIFLLVNWKNTDKKLHFYNTTNLV